MIATAQQAMQEYLNNQKATDATRRGQWITVDDLGYLDEDGYLYLAGRSRDMVISGGVNIYPAEIEEVLAAHPALREVAVIGVPDPEWGERLVAVVVCAQPVDDDELEQFARQHLTGYKVPRCWERVDELPRNPTGKVLKRQLVDTFKTDR